MYSRQARGRALAEAQGGRIKQVEGPLWFVPSSQNGGGYLVNVETGKCGCPDETERCKHVVAVEAVRGGLVKSDGQIAIHFPPLKMPRKGDLTAEERDRVRAALRFLCIQCGGYAALAKAIRFENTTLRHVASRRAPSAGLALRLARFAGVPVDDLLAGRYPPPGMCPHCGHRAETVTAPDGA